MAYLTLFIAATLATFACAGFPGWMDDDTGFPGFGPPLMTLRFPAPPKFPKVPHPSSMFFFNQFPFPTMPAIQFPPIPSPADILNTIPANSGSYNGVIVSTQSESKRNEDGTITKTGGSTIVINDNGKVTVNKTGDSPPEIITRIQRILQTFDNDPPKPKRHMFKPHEFKHFIFKPVDPEIIKTYVPKEGSYYSGHSKKTSKKVEEVNGKRKEEVSVSNVVNNNGNVTEENYGYQKEDKK